MTVSPAGPRPRPEILDISPYVGGESTIPGINRTIKLSSNEGAFGVPPGAQAAFVAMAGELHRYPDGSAIGLRRAIGAKFHLDPERIVCGAGSDDLLYQLCLAYGGPGTEIIMSEHGFSIFQIAGTYSGAKVLKALERELTADVDAILSVVSPATRIVFLANPNNPTGTTVPNAEVVRLRRCLPPHVLLVLDAAYAEYVDRPDYDAGVKLVEKTDGWYLTLAEDKSWRNEAKCKLVTTELLGKAKAPDCAFENADGSPLRINTDYFGKKRDENNPMPGPFETPGTGLLSTKVW